MASAVSQGDAFLPWFASPECQQSNHQPQQLEKVEADLTEAKKPHHPGRIVSALTFGHWATFFGKDCETLWQQVLHRIDKHTDGKGLEQKDLSAPLARLRMLRNRIAHHEFILCWISRKQVAAMVGLTT